MSAGFGNSDGMGAAGFSPGTRHTPGYAPTPNSEPMGAITGTPVRTQTYSRHVAAGAAQQLINGTRENKVAFITTPDIGFLFFVGDGGVTPEVGMVLPPGQTTEIPLPGFQELYIVSNAPIALRVSVQVSAILLAERERRL